MYNKLGWGENFGFTGSYGTNKSNTFNVTYLQPFFPLPAVHQTISAFQSRANHDWLSNYSERQRGMSYALHTHRHNNHHLTYSFVDRDCEAVEYSGAKGVFAPTQR